MLQTLVTPPLETEAATKQPFLRYTTFDQPEPLPRPTHHHLKSSPDMRITVSMQPMEVLPGGQNLNAMNLEEHNNLLSPDSSTSAQGNLNLPSGVPPLVEYSSQDTNESSQWESTEITASDGKKVSLFSFAQKRLRVQIDQHNESQFHPSSVIADHLASPPLRVHRSMMSQLSTIPMRGDFPETCNDDDEEDGHEIRSTTATAGLSVKEYRGNAEFVSSNVTEVTVQMKHKISAASQLAAAKTSHKNDPFRSSRLTSRHSRRSLESHTSTVSRARSVAVEKCGDTLRKRLDGILSDFDSRIDDLVANAKTDFAGLRSEIKKKTPPRSRPVGC